MMREEDKIQRDQEREEKKQRDEKRRTEETTYHKTFQHFNQAHIHAKRERKVEIRMRRRASISIQ